MKSLWQPQPNLAGRRGARKTMRAQGQTYRIAQRLQRGEKLLEDE